MTSEDAGNEERRGVKRSLEESSVEVPAGPEQVTVENASQRYTKWERMKGLLLKVAGVITGDEEEKPDVLKNDPTVVKNEPACVVAKAPHPNKDGVTVCLLEKSRGAGYVLMPDTALRPHLGRVVIETAGQQYSNWSSMEEKMGVKVTGDFKAKKGHEGVILAREAHPKEEGCEVLAVDIPDGGTILVKAAACQQLPIEVVEILDPLARFSSWPKMAEALGIEEPKTPIQLKKGMLGVPKAERKHLKQDDQIIVGVELLSGEGCIMMKKEALRYVKY
eukprot:Sspe_Gene.7193::Locus_2436_Transcript_1_1_Confidence_1.000_Length_937::g.7193::m.7193